MTLAIYSDEGLQLAAENLEVFTFTNNIIYTQLHSTSSFFIFFNIDTSHLDRIMNTPLAKASNEGVMLLRIFRHLMNTETGKRA
jgi:hypothetical protein